MKLSHSSYLLIASLSGVSACVHADPTAPSVILPVITETASASIGVETISGDDIKNRYGNLQSYLKSLTSMQVQHSGGLGDPVLLSVRGASGRQTTMLINGVRINDAQGGGYDLSQIPVDMIEQVEISSSGSNGGLYDGAIGGTINIITRDREYQRRIAAKLGNHGYRSISAQGDVNPMISLYAGSESSDNNFNYPVPTPWDGSERNSEEALNNAEFYRHTLQLSVHSGDIQSQVGWRHQSKNIPDYFRNSPINRARYSIRELTFSTGNGAKYSNNGFNLDWSVAASRKNESYQDPESSIGLGEDDNRYKLQHIEMSLAPYWQHEDIVVSTGITGEFDQYQSRYVNDPDSRECTTPDGSCDQTAQQSVININTGVDYQINPQWGSGLAVYHRRYDTSNERTHADNPLRTDIEQSFTGASASVDHRSQHSEIQLSARRSTRIPSLYERYGDRGLMLGNDDLAAETADNLSLDITLFDARSEANVVVFYRKTYDTIVPVYDSRGVGRYENSSDASMTGLESTLRHSLQVAGITFEPSLSAAHYTSELDSDIRAFNGKQLPGIYHDRYLASVTAYFDRKSIQHSLGLDVEVAGNLYLDSGNNNRGDIRRSIDLIYRAQLKTLSASVQVNNLLNNQFKDFSNRPVAGRQVYLSAQWQF
ncbi:TonB-dependent receptor [Thalassolituus maritimus]|uniref:TonB-dependent receptor n=1 Tax=Thalassolituus maritimus TaxID=484498 RepID=UPI00333F54F9